MQYSVREVADVIGVREETVRTYLYKALLRGFKTRSGRWYIPGADLLRLLQDWGYKDGVVSQPSSEPLIVIPQVPQIIAFTTGFHQLLSRQSVVHEDLLALGPREFESLIAELWSRFGYDVELTASTRDGGRDVIALRKSEADLRFLIECKRYAPDNKVDVSLVRALYGVKNDEKATKAILATTSTFTSPALRFFERHRWEMEPRDFNGVIDWIKRVKKSKA